MNEKRISWGAVLAGVTFVFVVQLLLTMLGMGIGLSMVGDASGKGIGWGAAAWWFVSALIAFYAGGWVAGRLSGIPKKADSVLHGMLTWNVATLLSLAVVTTALGKVVGGAFSAITGPSSQNYSMGVNRGDTKSIKEEARGIISGQRAGQRNLGADQDQEWSLIVERLFSPSNQATAEDREAAVNFLVVRMGMNENEAVNTVRTWEARKADIAAGTEKAASNASTVSLIGFFTLLLGGLFASLGGRAGTVKVLRPEYAMREEVRNGQVSSKVQVPPRV